MEVNMKALNFRRLSAVVVLALGALVTTAMAAFATPPAYETAATTAVSNAADSATNIVEAGIPVVLAVAVIWVALRFGRRLISSLG